MPPRKAPANRTAKPAAKPVAKSDKGKGIAQDDDEDDPLAKYGFSASLAKQKGGGMSIESQRAWLDRSKDWETFKSDAVNGLRYTPVKVLGGGNNETVGLWKIQAVDDENDGDEVNSRQKSGSRSRKKKAANSSAAEDNGDDEGVPPPQHIVIKQSIGGAKQKGQDAILAMQWESKILHQIMGTGTDHVVKIYRGYHRDGGSGTDIVKEPIPF